MKKNSALINWAELKAEFGRLVAVIEPFEILSEDEFEELKFSYLTYSTRSVTRQKLEHGFELFTSVSKDVQRQEALKTIAREMRFPDRSTQNRVLLSRRERKPPILDTITRAIEEETVNKEFILAWGKLNEIVTIYAMELAHPEKMAKAIGGMMAQSIEIQCYWYAYWIKENARSLDSRDREKPTEDFASVCYAISNDQRLPHAPYPKKWFSRVLDENGLVRGTVSRLGRPKLEELLSNPRVNATMLPPLNKALFAKNRTATP